MDKDFSKILTIFSTLTGKQVLTEAEKTKASCSMKEADKDETGKMNNVKESMADFIRVIDQVTEGRIDDLKDRQEEKRKEQGSSDWTPGTKEKPRQVKGTQYGGSKQKDDAEDKDDLDEAKEADDSDWTPGTKEKPRQVKGSRYGGSKQKDDAEDKDDLDESTPVEEDEVEEGNKFSGELAKAKATGQSEFKVDDKKYHVEGKKAKPDFLDVDKDGNKKEPMKKALKDKEKMKESAEVNECGMMAGNAMGMSDSGMSVNTNIDTRTGRKSVSVSADGEAADQLMQMLKLAGVGGADSEGEVEVVSVPLAHAEGGFKMGGEEEVEEEYSNEPNPQVQPTDTQMRQGTDLNKEKQMVKHSYKQGDNPMAMRESEELAALEAELFEELASIKKVKEEKKDDKKSMKKKMK